MQEEALLRRCLAGDRDAWEEFFLVYQPVILKGIYAGLKLCGYEVWEKDDDKVWDIYEKIVIKLYRDGELQKCADVTRFRGWLRTVSKNQAITWGRGRGRTKMLPTIMAEETSVSIEDPVIRDWLANNSRPIEDEEGRPEGPLDPAEKVLFRIMGLTNLKHRWAMRIAVLYIFPLSPEEISLLNDYSGSPESEVKRLLEETTRVLELIERKSRVSAGKAVVLWCARRRIEKSIDVLSRNPFANPAAIIELEKRLADMKRKREKVLCEARTFHRPSNKHVAELMGVPSAQEKDISTYFKRAMGELGKPEKVKGPVKREKANV